jgi:pyrrolidone-carboxylate peptidase
MKLLAAILALLAQAVWAKPVVLLGHYDAFGGAPFNNSQRIAEALENRLNTPDSPIQIRRCAMETVFDRSFAQVENCLRALPERPVMVISLGESTCDMKLELLMRNQDRTFGPDNAGNERNNQRIIPEAPDFLGQRFPLPQMYCALSAKERGEMEISNNAGSFVCNNTSFQMSWYYPEIQFGFIHVPAHKCRNLERRTHTAIVALEKMLIRGVEVLLNPAVSENLPHPSNETRLPVMKREMDLLRSEFEKQDRCLHEFFKRARGVDEKRGVWPF